LPDRPRVAIIAKGSRGDVQPVVALALKLQRAGVHVRVLTNYGTEGFVRSFSVEADGYPWEADPTQDVKARTLLDVLEVVCPSWATGEESRTIFRKVIQFAPGMVLYKRFNVFEGLAIQERLSIMAVEYGFCPDTAVLPEGVDGAEFRLRLVSRKRRFFDTQMLQQLTLEDIRRRPFLLALSEHVAEPEPGAKMTGFWLLGQRYETQLFQLGSQLFGGDQRRQLEDFLARGPPPVCIGWGSMFAVSRSFMGLLAVRALSMAEVRGVILGGDAALDPHVLRGSHDSAHLQEYAKRHVLWLQSAPHEWLMPRCSVTVHHGGCGTTAAALRAGRPTIVTPVGFDQFYWGRQVERKGVGILTVQLARLTAAALADALRRCRSAKIIKEAAALGCRLRAEDGTAVALEWLRAEARWGHRGGPLSQAAGS